ncbi:Roadblock/LAMTOR2 domain-containing protein [Frankia sp. AiPs1]|uniref:roadblock/LC7 domain-containing protein n=1 Tax=Frankia sp. AiPa1 TaxID=573492 RepID=UPI00202B5AE1|nr:roadblock/LC7 domain-containing protein [Frankia sp. AiPa1]MCL9760723.1 roadblock/LC7 domain-containing protein [Frankia sp. AiPa1]
MATSTISDSVLAELRSLREHVCGVTGTVVAAADGLLFCTDTEGVRAEVVAAMAAAALGLGRSTSQEVGLGSLREVVVRCEGGHVVVYAVGMTRLLVVLGDEGLDLERLHLCSREAVNRIGEVFAA